MRELKFRAWVSERKKMIFMELKMTPVKKSAYWMYEGGVGLSDLMQFTGLKDKNGKEIYEGDVVKGRSYDYVNHLKNRCQFDFEGKVEWSSQPDLLGLKWIIVSKNDSVWALGECCHRNDGYLNGEVIGNIYQNPELIK